MRTCLAAALICASGAAFADDVELSTRVDRVTVYPDGAIVTRIGRTELMQGVSRLVLRGLPASVDPASIRVEGKGASALSLGAVDVRQVPADASAAPDKALEDKLKALRETRAGLESRVGASEAKRATIERFGQAGPEKLGPGGHALPVTDWNAVFEAVGTALLGVNEELRGLKGRIETVDAEIDALEQARPRPGRRGAPLRDLTIAIEAGAAQSAEFAVSYRVGGANWVPTYEARLVTGNQGAKPTIELTRRAEIRQRTGEDWSAVTVTLSTARTAGGTQAPQLAPVQVAFFEPPVVYESRARAADAMRKESTARMAPAAAPAPVAAGQQAAVHQVAQLEAGAYQASFVVPGKVDVPQDGSSKTVILTQGPREATLSARVTPELEERAYLEAAFVHEEDAPLLAGQVYLHRDGTYIGRGRIAQTPPGQRVELGFGPDDRISVTRAPVRRRESESGWIGQTRTDLREFRTVVKSAHAQPVSVTVLDRIPFSENSAITVETLPQTTAPTQKQVGDRRGVLGWTFDLAPGAERELRLAYRIKWPGDRELTYEQQPVRPGPEPVPLPRPVN